MKEDIYLRKELVFQLEKGNAHMPFEEAIAHFPEKKMNVFFTNGDYSFWHVLEHIRRTQHDILDFIINTNYKEIEWPEDYWPKKSQLATREEWNTTIEQFLQDREQLKNLILDSKTELYTKIKWGTGQTFMREVLVVIDHNAYHIGEFAIMRQVLDAWDKKST